MTTIAYKDGVMAGDRATVSYGFTFHETTKVVRRASDGALLGSAGVATRGDALRRWFLAGEDPESKPCLGENEDDDVQAIIVRPNGAVELHDRFGWVVAEGACFAIGSGCGIALGAMDAGATARQAVIFAARRGVGNPDSVDQVAIREVAAARVATG